MLDHLPLDPGQGNDDNLVDTANADRQPAENPRFAFIQRDRGVERDMIAADIAIASGGVQRVGTTPTTVSSSLE